MLVVDTALRILYAEGNLFVRLGVDMREVKGSLLRDWTGPDRWVVLGPRYEAALAGEQQSFERWERDDSIYSIEITPVRDGSGEVKSLLVVFQDVTERARATRALERSEARL